MTEIHLFATRGQALQNIMPGGKAMQIRSVSLSQVMIGVAPGALLDEREQGRLVDALFASSRLNTVSYILIKGWPGLPLMLRLRPNKLQLIHWSLTPSPLLLPRSPRPASPACLTLG